MESLSNLSVEAKAAYSAIFIGGQGLVVALIAKLWMSGNQVNLYGPGSISYLTFWYVLANLIAVFWVNIWQSRLLNEYPRGRNWLDSKWFSAITLFVPYFTFFTILQMMYIAVLRLAFTEASMHWTMGLLFCAISSGVSIYLAMRLILSISQKTVMRMFALFMLIGVIGAAIAAENDQWWTESVSYLGLDARSSLIFNTTMIVGGLMVVLIGRFIYHRLDAVGGLDGWRSRVLVWGSFTLGLLMVLIGCFEVGPNRISNSIHMIAANIFGAVCIAAMFGTYWYVNMLPRHFHLTSAVLGSLYVLFGCLYYLVGVVSFAVMELLVFIFAGGWLYVFLETVVEYEDKVQKPREKELAVIKEQVGGQLMAAE